MTERNCQRVTIREIAKVMDRPIDNVAMQILSRKREWEEAGIIPKLRHGKEIK